MKQTMKKWATTILLGLSIAFLTLCIIIILLSNDYIDRLVDTLDGMAYDIAFKNFKAKLKPSEEIVIVDTKTDNDDIINRDDCYRLIEQLVHTRAKVIAFDIIFKRTENSEWEQRIIQLCETCGKVVNCFSIYGTYPIDDYQLIERKDLAQYNALKPGMFHFEDDHAPLEFDNGRVKFPFDTVFALANGLGHVNFSSDNDGIVRRFPLVITYSRKYYPSLAVQILRKYHNIADTCFHVTLSKTERSLTIMGANNEQFYIPLDQYAQMILNFIPEERYKAPPLSLQEALFLSEDPDASDFDNKIVYVIKSIGENPDFSHVPLSHQYPNWLIHASIISQILQQRYLVESARSLIFFAIIAVLFVIFWLLLIEVKIKYLKTKSWLVLLGSLFLLFWAAVILINFGIWPGLVIPWMALAISYIVTKFFIYFCKWRPWDYHSFVILVQKKAKAIYLVDVIESPAGQAYEGEFRINLGKFQQIMRHLQSLNAERPEVRKFGEDLFLALFPDQAKGRYNENLGIISKSKSDRLRIQLRIESPEISMLPWEYLYDPDRRMHLALNKKLSIARYPMIPIKTDPLEIEPPIKILVFIASPAGHDALNVADEIARINDELKKSKWRDQVKLEIIRKTTVEIFRKKVRACHVIHYIGHGEFSKKQKEEIGALIFENDSGGSEKIGAERLALMLCNTNVRLVILNACETAKTSTYDAFLGVAPALINAGIPAAIAMQFPMPDPSAIIFSEEFYRSLAKNYHVDAALAEARIAMAERIGLDRIDWGIPVLFMRSPDGLLFRPMS